MEVLICSLNVVYYYCHSQFQVIVPSVVIYYLNIIYITKYIIYLQDQYVVVNEAVSEALTVSDTGIEKDTFCDHLENQQNKPIAKNQTFLRLEFQVH
jgi:hypothetical protein